MSGPGAHFTSPQKPRDPKNQTVVRGFGTAARAAALRERIEARKNPGRASAPSEPAPLSANVADPQDDVQMPDWVDVPSEIPKIPHSSFLPPTLVPAPSSLGTQHVDSVLLGTFFSRSWSDLTRTISCRAMHSGRCPFPL
ncbi:hypothetical protein B0H14DRAFT_3424872 [Mycena olivaceomarginata]|nr:hypothetical protein B0H14DRAFT_3424872 [Mycena olivaceomarginata]